MRMLMNGVDQDTNQKIIEIESSVKETKRDIKEIVGNTSLIPTTFTASLDQVIKKIEEVKTQVSKLDLIKSEITGIQESISLLSKVPEQIILPQIEVVKNKLTTFLSSSELKYASKQEMDEKQILASGYVNEENNKVELKHNLSKTFGVDLLINYQCFGGINSQEIVGNQKKKNGNQKIKVQSNMCGVFQIYSKDKDTLVVEYLMMPSFAKIKILMSGIKNGVLDLYIQPEE